MFFRVLVFTALFFFAHISSAAEVATQHEVLSSEISKIRIFGTGVDRIHFHLTDNSHRQYRFSSLSENQAQGILKSIQQQKSLILKTQSSDGKGYLRVLGWQ